MPTKVTSEGLHPPARLSTAVLLGTLAISGTLLWAQRHDQALLEEASRAHIADRLLQTLGTEAGEQLRLPVAIGDRDLVLEVGRRIVQREPSLAGMVIHPAGGAPLHVGTSFDSPWTHQVPIVGTSTAIEGLLLGAEVGAAVPKKLGTLHLYARTSSSQTTPPRTPRLSPWLLAIVPFFGLGAALWFRERLLRLCEISTRVSHGDIDQLPKLRGSDELAWAANQLRGVSDSFASRVEHVQGRNAALLRDVTLKEDRLQRIANFASTLVAPLHEHNPWPHVIESLARDCDASLGLLFVQQRDTSELHLEAASGMRAETPSQELQGGLARAGVQTPQAIERAIVLPTLPLDHPWMLDRNIPLLGVAALPLRFRGRLEGIVVLAKPRPWTTVDLEFMEDVAPPLAIALANRRAFQASVDLAHVLEQRNDELVQQKNRLEIVDRMRAQFVANISHELRTPLNAIIGYTELVVDECFGPVTEKQVSSLESVLESSHHLLQLVNQVLDLSRAEAGELSTDLRTCDVFAVARESVRLLQPLTRDRPYELQFKGSPAPLYTDPERVHQILTNLVSNAIKFTKEGSVSVRVIPEANGGVRIIVEDTGIGIDESHLELVFEAFRQVDGSTTRTHDGAGLGLAISRSLALALGGSLSVTSVLGKGSTFTLHLPKRTPALGELSSARPPLPKAS